MPSGNAASVLTGACVSLDATAFVRYDFDGARSRMVPTEIAKRRSAVLMSRAEYDALQETAYLLRSPANAKRLLRSLGQARSGRAVEREVVPD